MRNVTNAKGVPPLSTPQRCLVRAFQNASRSRALIKPCAADALLRKPRKTPVWNIRAIIAVPPMAKTLPGVPKPSNRPQFSMPRFRVHRSAVTFSPLSWDSRLYPGMVPCKPGDATAQLVKISAGQLLRAKLPDVVLEHEAVHPLQAC